MLLWLVLVILTVAVWPASAALEGEFDQWMSGVLWQADRINQVRLNALQHYTQVALVQDQDPDILTRPASLLVTVIEVFMMDPILMSLGTVGLAFAAAVRSRFVLLWVVPVLLFFGSVGWVNWFHLGMLWTAMCIAAAALIGGGIKRAYAGGWGPRGQYTLLLAAVLVAVALGLSTSAVLVHWDATSAYSEAVAFTMQNHANSDAQIMMQLVDKSWLSGIYNLTDSGAVDDNSFYNKHPEKTRKIIMVEFASEIKTAQSRHGDIYGRGSMVAEFQNPSKPDTPIPAVVRGSHSIVGVMEWDPPGWTSLSAYGPAGRALHLDGTAYVTLADTPGLDLGGTDPFSLAFWIKMPAPGESDLPIVSKAEDIRQQGITVWGNSGGGISLRMTDDVQGQITVNTFSSMADGSWHHVVFTYDGSRRSDGLDVYVDGQIDNLRRAVTSLAGSVANDHLLAIGAGSTGKEPAQDTALDDIMIYSARLPADYISDVHECHVAAATVLTASVHACMGDYDGALLAHLEFEGDLTDSSGGGGGGTAHGDVKYT